MSRLLLNYHDIAAAYSEVPRDYEGPCRVVLDGNREEEDIVCPDRATAEHVAQLAVGEVGGYCGANVEPAPGCEVTVTDAVDWLLN